MIADWLNHPVGGLDTETTGVDMETARIVTATVHFTGVKDPSDRNRTWLINPGVPIPPEATAVHGVTDEMAAEGDDPISALAEIDRWLRWLWDNRVPVIGHNIVFDLTILDRELRRHLGRPLEITGPVIDTLVLDKAVDPYRKGSRRLADACAHWGVPVAEADLHTSAGDVVAAVKLAWRIVNYGEWQHDGKFHRLTEFPLDYLHSWQAAQYQEQRKSFNAWLTKQGKTPDDTNMVWPVKPYNGKVE